MLGGEWGSLMRIRADEMTTRGGKDIGIPSRHWARLASRTIVALLIAPLLALSFAAPSLALTEPGDDTSATVESEASPSGEEAEADAQPSDADELCNVTIAYSFDGRVVGLQEFSDMQQGELIRSSDLEMPSGYSLKSPFPDFTVYEDQEITVELVKAEKPLFDVTVRYLLDGEEIGREVLAGLPELFVVHDEDLTIPEGFVQANPMVPHVVVASDTIDVPVLRNSVPVADVMVWFVYDGKTEGLQIYRGIPIGAVITEATLVLPNGFVLAGPFADYTVTGQAELTLAVVPVGVDPEPEKPVIDTPDTDTEEDVPPAHDGKGATTELANSGTQRTAAIAAAAFGALGLGLVLMLGAASRGRALHRS